jgi:arylsulfatase
MSFSQQAGLLLSGTMALSAWSPAVAQNNDATLPHRDAATPSWPEPPKAPAGAPNVVLILLDDVGFGATSTENR